MVGSNAVDAQLDLGALQRQDPAAFERLYGIFAPELRRYLVRLCRDAAAVDDLLQEIFHRAFRALPATTRDLEPRPWLYAIATNTARSAARAAYWRHERTCPADVLTHVADTAAAAEVRIAAADLVERALTALKPDQARLVLLHWWEGFGIDELCVIEGVARDTLKKRLYRARKAFGTAYAVESARARLPVGCGHEGGT